MGNRFIISVDDETEQLAFEKIDWAFQRIRDIEEVFTTYSTTSLTHKVNIAAGERPVEVTEEFFGLVDRSLRISSLTQGAFDISYGSVHKKLWNFDPHMTHLPLHDIEKNKKLVNYKNIILDEPNQTIFLKGKGMRIGFGGIGKGYAADQAADLLKSLGVSNGVVNAAGDLITWGKYEGTPWTIQVADPESPSLPFAMLETGNLAVATSGDYEKFTLINHEKFSHTISPQTGLPVQGLRSVTVMCPYAELADAMATAVTVMGIEKGLSLINQMKDMACLIVDDEGQIFTSRNVEL